MRYTEILLVEDNKEFALKIQAELGRLFHVVHALNIPDAILQIQKKVPDLILLDIDLGDEIGFDLAIEIKKSINKDIPIIYLTSSTSVSNRVTGYSLGADDFIQKSADMFELQVRIKNVLNRRHGEQASVLEKYGIQIDLLSRKVNLKQDGVIVELSLSPTEFNILVFFLKHEGHALSRNQILDAVWTQKLNVSDRTIDTHIFSLRKKLDKKSFLIESVFGIGYRFSDNQESHL